MPRHRAARTVPPSGPAAVKWYGSFPGQWVGRSAPTEPDSFERVRPDTREDKDAFVLVCVTRMASGASREQMMDLLEWDHERLSRAARIGQTMIGQMG